VPDAARGRAGQLYLRGGPTLATVTLRGHSSPRPCHKFPAGTNRAPARTKWPSRPFFPCYAEGLSGYKTPMLDRNTLSTLRQRAFDLRIDNLTSIAAAGNGHPGGTLSVMDILQTLFFSEMKHRPQEPLWAERDRLVLSKGHAVPALYTVMAHAGYFSRDALPTLRRLGSPLQGHPATFLLPGIEASTGSLGQGLSMALGMALASRLDGGKSRVYAIIGDGESQEGQIWEAAMAAPRFQLDNLCVILDHNKGQIDGPVKEVMDIDPIADKWRAFNWNVLTIDGHDYEQIHEAFEKARATKGKPTFILAETTKGKGVSFMEGKISWHGVAPSKEQLEQAITELKAARAALASPEGRS
jgi:transketolase